MPFSAWEAPAQPTDDRCVSGAMGFILAFSRSRCFQVLFTPPPTRATWAPPWAAQLPVDTGSRGPLSGGVDSVGSPQLLWRHCVLLSLSVCLLHPRGRGPGPRTQDPSSLSPEPGALRGSQETVQGPGDKVTPRTSGTGCRQVMDCGLSHCMLGKELPRGGQGTEDIAEWARQLVRACATPPGGHGHLDSLVCRHPLFI